MTDLALLKDLKKLSNLGKKLIKDISLQRIEKKERPSRSSVNHIYSNILLTRIQQKSGYYYFFTLYNLYGEKA
ncbi:hypothetical protein [Flammeovirga sp. OC4]|uniref:hypothetical protein n=1 Tax=Flammeovirga sp. OC4 TaxID=1382345 RepID=UPI0005C69913|nr:hypothetical protein [Flammeovirga sp. OC4]